MYNTHMETVSNVFCFPKYILLYTFYRKGINVIKHPKGINSNYENI